MNTIGIIAPKDNRITKYKKIHFLKNRKPDFIFNEKHLVCFVVAYDNQNYNKIFRENKVLYAVCADGVVLKDKPFVRICDGKDFFNKNLMYFVIKAFKLYGLNSESSILSVVDDDFSEQTVKLIIQASKLFRYISIVSDNINKTNELSDTLMSEYGITVECYKTNQIVNSDISIEITNKNILYKKDTIIINSDSNIAAPTEYNITLPHTIPFKAKTLSLSQALYYIKQNN